MLVHHTELNFEKMRLWRLLLGILLLSAEATILFEPVYAVWIGPVNTFQLVSKFSQTSLQGTSTSGFCFLSIGIWFFAHSRYEVCVSKG